VGIERISLNHIVTTIEQQSFVRVGDFQIDSSAVTSAASPILIARNGGSPKERQWLELSHVLRFGNEIGCGACPIVQSEFPSFTRSKVTLLTRVLTVRIHHNVHIPHISQFPQSTFCTS
jgi:hypothetical protein